ncbi:beta strand repeat-containing protein [Breznakiella homolactica]|uniref:Uncharacterized protein n=1 Tax=Breznakiella homolactica TaxID=2798577 RepID=A0A7T7XPV2_9SPIR|nr:hypothetical protein [Breznakiella homolactica]QQO10300.1 hypothetical protein JFL75_05105 [Breznakiella homolactica]
MTANRNEYSIAAACTLLFLSCFLSGCDLFNLSAPDYIDKYTTSVVAEDPSLHSDHFTEAPADPKNIKTIEPINPGDDPAVVRVRLMNAAMHSLNLTLYHTAGDGSRTAIDPSVAAPVIADYKTVYIEIRQAQLRDSFRFYLDVEAADETKRKFDAVTAFPLIVCNIPPEPAAELRVDTAVPAGGPAVANWEMYVTGDHDDVEEVVLQFQKGTPQGPEKTKEYVYRYDTNTGRWRCSDGNLELSSFGAGTYPNYVVYSRNFPMNMGSDPLELFDFCITLRNTYGFEKITATPGFDLDQSPPVTVSRLAAQNDEYLDRIPIVLSAEKNGVTADRIRYRVNGGSPQYYAGQFWAYSGDSLIAWSETTGHIDSSFTMETITLNNYIYVSPSEGAAGNDGWSRKSPVASFSDAKTKWEGVNGTARYRYMLLENITQANASEVTDGSNLFNLNNLGIASGELVLVGDPLAVSPITINAGSGTRRVMALSGAGLTVSLRDLVLTGGNTTGNGGGILVSAGGLVLGSGTVIRGNTAGDGGGVYITGGTLELRDGAVIENNTGNLSGGGVHVRETGVFAMSGGIIRGNEAKISGAGGGGVAVADGTGTGTKFTMTGGTISGNYASNSSGYGGGVLLFVGVLGSGPTEFTMQGGSIEQNWAGYGGGILVTSENSGQMAVFTMSGTAKVTDNGRRNGTVVTKRGGGIAQLGLTRFNFNNGTVTGNYSSEAGGGIFVTGVTSAATNPAAFSMSNGTVNGNSSAIGGGIAVYQAVSAIVSGGSLSGNTASGSGGGLYVKDGSNFTMEGGTIGGTPNTAASGGGVFIDTNGAVFMTGGRIQGNTSGGGTNEGVRIETSTGIFQMSGSARVAEDNVVYVNGTDTDLFGFRIGSAGFSPSGSTDTIARIQPKSYLTTDPVIIPGDGADAGIIETYCRRFTVVPSGGNNWSVSKTGYLVVSTVIQATLTRGIPYLSFPSDPVTYIPGGLPPEISVTGAAVPGNAQWSGWLLNASNTRIGLAGSTGSSYTPDISAPAGQYTAVIVLRMDGISYTGSFILTVGTGSITYSRGVTSWSELQTAVAGLPANTSASFTILDDLTFTGTISVGNGKKVTLLTPDGSTKTIKRGSTADSAFEITASGELSIGSSSGILRIDGDKTSSGNSMLISVTAGGIFTMYSNAELADNKRSSNGGAVSVNGGTFNMHGGTITGCTASSMYGGGGVYMSAGTFTMHGGTISENQVTATGTNAGGGGVYAAGGTFTMYGGTVSGNSVSVGTGGGGGVAVAGQAFGTAQFIMRGGNITGNTVTGTGTVSGGGGVYVVSRTGDGNKNAEFIMHNGSISNNTVTSSSTFSGGGGVLVTQSNNADTAEFIMHGGEITGNTATITSGAFTGGGGVHARNARFILNGGTISGNTAALASGVTSSGGGGILGGGGDTGRVVYIEMNGGTVSGNRVTGGSGGGGGIYFLDGSPLLAGGSVVSNQIDSGNSGSGLYVNNGLTINGDFFVGQDNNVYLRDYKYITIGGTLSPAGGITAYIVLQTPSAGTKVLAGGTGLLTANHGRFRWVDGDTIKTINQIGETEG